MVKEKPNSVRTYDEDGFRKRAACICLKPGSDNEVLLVNSSRHPDQWIIPGGGVEPGEELEFTAMREIEEEAGVIGTLEKSLGIFESSDKKTRTMLYIMKVTEELEEWEESRAIGRQRQWFPIEEAMKHLRLYKPLHLTYLEEYQKSLAESKKTT